MSNDIWSLEDVDYSDSGNQLEAVVAGQLKRQIVIYSAFDYEGNKWYYTQEGHHYILDSRRRRNRQRFVINYLSSIPTLVRQPIIVGRDLADINKRFYYGLIAAAEHKSKRNYL